MSNVFEPNHLVSSHHLAEIGYRGAVNPGNSQCDRVFDEKATNGMGVGYDIFLRESEIV